MPETEVKTELSLVKGNPQTTQLQRPSTSFAPRTIDEAITFCKFLANSDLVPKDYKDKPENVFVAVQMGAELGIAPMQALSNIAVINGRGAVWGDLMLAIVMAHPAYEWHKEWIDGEGDKRTAHFQIKRKGHEVHESGFSVAAAKTAKLWGKTGKEGQATPWVTHPDRMLQMRARGFGCRDKFADALKGIITVEEAQDYEVIEGGSLVEQTRQRDIPSQDPGDVPIGRGEKAMAFYRCWKGSGWTVDQAKAKMKELSGADTSDMIPEKHYAKCMEWAQTKPQAAEPEKPAENPDAEPCEQGK